MNIESLSAIIVFIIWALTITTLESIATESDDYGIDNDDRNESEYDDESKMNPYFVRSGKLTYKFGYDSKAKGAPRLMREETRLADGMVVGRYGYTDPFGMFRVVQYVAGPHGYYATEDIGGSTGPSTPLLYKATARQIGSVTGQTVPEKSMSDHLATKFNPPLYHPEAHLAETPPYGTVINKPDDRGERVSYDGERVSYDRVDNGRNRFVKVNNENRVVKNSLLENEKNYGHVIPKVSLTENRRVNHEIVNNGHSGNGRISNGHLNNHRINNGHLNTDRNSNGHLNNNRVKIWHLSNDRINNGYASNGHASNGYASNDHAYKKPLYYDEIKNQSNNIVEKNDSSVVINVHSNEHNLTKDIDSVNNYDILRSELNNKSRNEYTVTTIKSQLNNHDNSNPFFHDDITTYDTINSAPKDDIRPNFNRPNTVRENSEPYTRDYRQKFIFKPIKIGSSSTTTLTAADFALGSSVESPSGSSVDPSLESSVDSSLGLSETIDNKNVVPSFSNTEIPHLITSYEIKYNTNGTDHYPNWQRSIGNNSNTFVWPEIENAKDETTEWIHPNNSAILLTEESVPINSEVTTDAITSTEGLNNSNQMTQSFTKIEVTKSVSKEIPIDYSNERIHDSLIVLPNDPSTITSVESPIDGTKFSDSFYTDVIIGENKTENPFVDVNGTDQSVNPIEEFTLKDKNKVYDQFPIHGIIANYGENFDDRSIDLDHYEPIIDHSKFINEQNNENVTIVTAKIEYINDTNDSVLNAESQNTELQNQNHNENISIKPVIIPNNSYIPPLDIFDIPQPQKIVHNILSSELHYERASNEYFHRDESNERKPPNRIDGDILIPVSDERIDFIVPIESSESSIINNNEKSENTEQISPNIKIINTPPLGQTYIPPLPIYANEEKPKDLIIDGKSIDHQEYSPSLLIEPIVNNDDEKLRVNRDAQFFGSRNDNGQLNGQISNNEPLSMRSEVSSVSSEKITKNTNLRYRYVLPLPPIGSFDDSIIS